MLTVFITHTTDVPAPLPADSQTCLPRNLDSNLVWPQKCLTSQLDTVFSPNQFVLRDRLRKEGYPIIVLQMS